MGVEGPGRGIHVEVQGQLVGASSLLPSHGSWVQPRVLRLGSDWFEGAAPHHTPISLQYSKSWSSVGSSVWAGLGSVALLEKVCRWCGLPVSEAMHIRLGLLFQPLWLPHPPRL